MKTLLLFAVCVIAAAGPLSLIVQMWSMMGRGKENKNGASERLHGSVEKHEA